MSGPGVNGQLRAIEAMFFALTTPAARELERAMRACLAAPQPTLHEQRETNLGHLAMMVAEDLAHREPEDRRPPRVPRKDYEASRPPEAASGAALVNHFGSWVEACRAAAALERKGREAGGGKPWQTPSIGGRRGRNYTREEVIDGVIEVAHKLDRDPRQLTSTAYYRYVAEMRRCAKAKGAAAPRWATQRSVQRFFHSWPAVRRAIRAEMRRSGRT